MNIKGFFNSIIGYYDKTGLNKKNISTELIFFISIKTLNDKKRLSSEVLDLRDNKAKEILLNHLELNKYFNVSKMIEVENYSKIIDELDNYIKHTDDELLFKNVSTLIDVIHTIYNPKHAQYYTNQSMAKLNVELLVNSCNIEQLKTQDEVSIYEPSSGTGNLIFPLIDKLIENGIKKENIKVYANEYDSEVAFILYLLLNIKDISFEIKIGDTLTNYFIEDNNFKKFDFIISNPPFGLGYNQEELLNHSVYDLYKEGKKLNISKKSDSLLVFLEIIRRSYKQAATIIGSVSIQDFNKYYIDNKNSNSVLGNIVKDKQLNTIIKQNSNMFHNTSIKSTILLLTNKNDEFNFIDIDKEGLYINNTSNVVKGSKMKYIYSDDNISSILDIINNKKNNRAYKENSNISGLMEDIYKIDQDLINSINNIFTDNQKLLKMKANIKKLQLSLIDKEFKNNLYSNIAIKSNSSINEVKNVLENKNNKEIDLYIERILKDNKIYIYNIEKDVSSYKIKINNNSIELMFPIATNNIEENIINNYLNTIIKNSKIKVEF